MSLNVPDLSSPSTLSCNRASSKPPKTLPNSLHSFRQDGEQKAERSSQKIQIREPRTIPEARAYAPERPKQEEGEEEQLQTQEGRSE